MTKQEALQKIEEAENNIKEAENNIKELKAFIEQENKTWKPKQDERYYYISEFGDIGRYLFSKTGSCDTYRLQIANCFKTEEQAKKSFKYWAMNESEYEYSLPYAPETWFDDYEDCECWSYSGAKWIKTINELPENLTYRRKRK